MSIRKVYFGQGGVGMLSRGLSHGYKSLIMDEDLGMGNLINFETSEEALVMSPVDGNADLSNDAITFICDSFGVCNIKSKISIIFCDDGKMLVTLYYGMLHINYDGVVVSPACGITEDVSMRSGIKWVDMDTILAMRQYFGTELQQRYYQDFEYFFEVCGGSDKNNCATWSCRCLKDEYIDMSLGFIAETEIKIMRRERQREVNKICAMFTNPMQSQITLAGQTAYDNDGLEVLEEEY